MWCDPEDLVFELSSAEMAILSRAAQARGLESDPTRTNYTKAELVEFGLIRETFSTSELSEAITGRDIISSHDPVCRDPESRYGVGSPWPSRVGKWQLPVPLPGVKPVMISFPPGSSTARKVQPAVSDERRGGAFRFVLTGSLGCNGVDHGPMEWFYVPNGTQYSLKSHDSLTTTVLYLFDFPSSEADGRFTYEA